MKIPSLSPTFATAGILLLAGVTLAGNGLAQQTPAAKPSTTATTSAKKAPAKAAPAPLVLKTQKEKSSYAIGASVGRTLKRDEVDIDPAILLRGLKDALAGGKLLLTDQEAQAAIATLQRNARAKQEAKVKVAGPENQKAGEAFLAANKSKEGVVTLPNGLQYKVMKQGDGPKPTAADTVECNYRGTLISGKEFDSSYKRGQPATFPLNGVIKGWTEVLQLMPVGSKYEVFIPSNLAYGERSMGADIGPNSTLIFEIELLSIKPKAAEAAKPVEMTKPSATAKPAEPAK